jgi:hypothetical protein
MRIGRCSIRFVLACALIVSMAIVEFTFPLSPVLSAPPGPRPSVTPLVKPTAVPLVQPTEVPPTVAPTATVRPRPRATVMPQLPAPPLPVAPVIPPVPPAQPGPAVAALAGHLIFEVYKPGMSKPTYDIYISRPDGTDRRLLWEWGDRKSVV